MALELDFTLKRNNGTDIDLLYPTTRWAQINEKPVTFTPTAHTHGNITDDGKIGTTSNLVVVTTTDGLLTTLSRSGIDSRTSFTPASHAVNASTYGYGTTTNAGHLRVGEGITVSSGTIALTNHGTTGSISANTTLTIASHKNRTILVNAAAVITIPTNATAAFPIGTHIDFIQTGSGEVSFTPASGVSLLSEGSKTKINAQYQAVTLIKTGTDIWVLVGALKT